MSDPSPYSCTPTGRDYIRLKPKLEGDASKQVVLFEFPRDVIFGENNNSADVNDVQFGRLLFGVDAADLIPLVCGPFSADGTSYLGDTAASEVVYPGAVDLVLGMVRKAAHKLDCMSTEDYLAFMNGDNRRLPLIALDNWPPLAPSISTRPGVPPSLVPNVTVATAQSVRRSSLNTFTGLSGTTCMPNNVRLDTAGVGGSSSLSGSEGSPPLPGTRLSDSARLKTPPSISGPVGFSVADQNASTVASVNPLGGQQATVVLEDKKMAAITSSSSQIFEAVASAEGRKIPPVDELVPLVGSATGSTHVGLTSSSRFLDQDKPMDRESRRKRKAERDAERAQRDAGRALKEGFRANTD